MLPSRSQLLPVTVVSGFLGAGKTSLLNHVLKTQPGRKYAVIVNHMEEDPKQGPQQITLSPLDKHSVALNDGCICCTLRTDLAAQVMAIARSGECEYLLIEATGSSEPLALAESLTSFDACNGEDSSLGQVLRVDTMVTVVDASTFLRDWKSEADLRQRVTGLPEDDERGVSAVLAAQVELANVLVINKVDMVASSHADRVEGLLRLLNPSATIVRATHGAVPIEALVHTQSFDLESAEQGAGWFQALHGPPAAESESHGSRSFVYRARLPFHPARFWDMFAGQEDLWRWVQRSQGIFWLASRMDLVGNWSHAGGSALCEAAGFWYAALPEADWPREAQEQEDVKAVWEEPFGDRRQELVFIGEALDTPRLRRRLDACLLSEAEMAAGPAAWSGFADPLPAWHVCEDSDHH